MWEWYRIGVAAGIGAGVAVIAAAWLARTRPGALLAILIGAAGGIAVGFRARRLEGRARRGDRRCARRARRRPLAAGTLRRGGTVIGTGILIGLAGLAIAALALIRFSATSKRSRCRRWPRAPAAREPERYAGLRTLARDSWKWPRS